MKLLSSSLLVVATTITLLGSVAAEPLARPCDTKAGCMKTVSCPASFTLHQEAFGKYVCRKATSEVQTASLGCDGGATMKHVAGVDVCEKDRVVTPTCRPIGVEKYTWDASVKKCKRNSGPDTWKDQNIKCPSGTSYKPSGKCEGTTSTPVWSAYNLDACDDLLDGSGWVADFVGNKDMCVSSSTEYAWKSPTID